MFIQLSRVEAEITEKSPSKKNGGTCEASCLRFFSCIATKIRQISRLLSSAPTYNSHWGEGEGEAQLGRHGKRGLPFWRSAVCRVARARACAHTTSFLLTPSHILPSFQVLLSSRSLLPKAVIPVRGQRWIQAIHGWPCDGRPSMDPQMARLPPSTSADGLTMAGHLWILPFFACIKAAS